MGALLLGASVGCGPAVTEFPKPSATPTSAESATPTTTSTIVPAPVDVSIETRVEGVPDEVSALADEAFALFDQPFPASWDAPATIAELEPLVADTVIVEDWISAGAEPGSVMLESIEEGYWAEISAHTFFVDLALNWHCAWLNEFVEATEAGEVARAAAAHEYLLKFPDMPQVREQVPDVDDLQDTVVGPLSEGDLEPAKSYLEQCRSLAEG